MACFDGKYITGTNDICFLKVFVGISITDLLVRGGFHIACKCIIDMECWHGAK